MPALSTLPPELQLLIFEHCTFRSHYSLALVSKSIRPLATACLYRKIHLWDCCTGYLAEWTRKTLQPLLRSLIENPKLAALVKSVCLQASYEYVFGPEEDYLEEPDPQEPDSELCTQALGLVQQLQLADQEAWVEALQGGSIDAWLSLLISQLGALELLQLSTPLLHRSTHLSKVLNHMIRPGSDFFNRLGHVLLGDDEWVDQVAGAVVEHAMFIPFYCLPALKEFELTVNSPNIKQWGIRDPLESLKILRLWDCNMTADEVDGFLALAPNLTELYCGFVRDVNDMDTFRQRIDFALLHSALTRVSSSVEFLTVDVRWNDRNNERGTDHFGVPLRRLGAVPMGSLREFHAVKRLKIPVELLLGKRPRLADVLPPNLHHLTLIDETVIWISPEGAEPEALTDRVSDHALQDVIDALDVYLGTPREHASLEEVVLDLRGLIYYGNDLVDPDNPGVYQSAQVRQLRRMAETSRVGVWVSYKRVKKVLGAAEVPMAMGIFDR
ncbi:uncharacterized protein BJX67DRAFT_378825 [Aspergillus lucknowensis]|uniref:F-box domain-containing protein n=1 Tax=Aspergillus lucknowensis TaxID=176173 RepID=A0ABR4LZ04_9EURO